MKGFTNRVLMLIAVAAVAFAPKALAVGVLPMLMEIDAVGGGAYKNEISVVNENGEDVVVKMYLSDWDKRPDGTDTEQPPGSNKRSCANWIGAFPHKAAVPGFQDIKFDFSINVPSDAAGSYWTFMVLEETRNVPVDDGEAGFAGPRLTLRYAVRIIVNVRSKTALLGEITGIELLRAGKPSHRGADKDAKHRTLRVRFNNLSDAILRPAGYMEIHGDAGGTMLQTLISADTYVLPGRERWLDIPVDADLPAGGYSAVVLLDYGGENAVAGESKIVVEN